MFRVLAAAMFAAAVVLSPNPASAVKIVSAKSGSHTAGKLVQRYHRSRHTTAIAIPRCGMIRKSSYHVQWHGLACPKIAWAGSAPRQPWSYEVFRHQAQWEQQSQLWQSHFRPSRSHPTIYWGY